MRALFAAVAALLLLAAPPAHAATAFVNYTEGGNNSAVNFISATAANHTTGNAIFVAVTHQNSPLTCTDTAGNTYLSAGISQSHGSIKAEIYYAFNITGNASNVVTCTIGSAGTGGFFGVAVYQFSGMGAGTLDDADGANISGASVTLPTLTLTASEGVAFVSAENDNATGFTAGAGYTANGSTAGLGYMGAEYKIVTASEAPTLTAGNSDGSYAEAMFGAAGGGGGGGSTLPYRSLMGVGR